MGHYTDLLKFLTDWVLIIFNDSSVSTRCELEGQPSVTGILQMNLILPFHWASLIWCSPGHLRDVHLVIRFYQMPLYLQSTVLFLCHQKITLVLDNCLLMSISLSSLTEIWLLFKNSALSLALVYGDLFPLKFHHVPPFFFFFFFLILTQDMPTLESERERERERESYKRKISICCLPFVPQPGIKPST